MLSVEKPPPPDPQCSNNIQKYHHHHHHHSTNTDHHHLLPLPVTVDLDLPNPPLTPNPNFSIRDYVFTARSKDIKTNWPFSQKNLQLCLKHGVKDVLPPFQSLDTVRNQVCTTCTVENAQSICNNNYNIDDEDEPAASKPADHIHAVLDSFNYDTQCPQEIKIPSTFVDTVTSCRSGESNLFPSTTTSVCQSEIEQSLLSAIKSTSSPLQADTSLEAVSVEVEAEPAAPRAASHKTQTAARSSGKNKCKLIVKFGSHSDRSSTEDIASNCTTQSETMASKICPVCKTFSSSSNTTLNAHIDQCLSAEESTPKWTVDSKLTRHRIKPRKTRLMVDIYATALPCTLEDLDRRNGSNWASPSRFPISDPESDKSDVPVEETMKHRVSPVSPNDLPSRVDVGDVYIDSNGIKLRILSKSDNIAPPISKVIQHLRPRKPFKGGKGSKFFSARKKKRRASKFSKYLKLAQNKKLRSSKALASQISGGLGKNHVVEGSSEKEVCNIPKQINPNNSGTLRQWACSKRTGVVKKFNNKMRHQHMQCNWNVSEDLRAEIDQSHFDSSICQNHDEDDLMDLSGSPVSTHDKTDDLENMLSGAQGSCVVEQSPVGKGAGSSLYIAGIKTERPLTPMKRNARQLRKERSSEKDYHMLQPPKSTAISTSLPSPIDNSDPPPSIYTKSSRSCHASRSKARKVSSARKDMLSSKRTYVDESTSDVSTKCEGHKNPQFYLRTDEEMVPLDSEAIQPRDHNFAVNYQRGRDDVNEESSFCRNTGPTIRQNTGVLGVSRRKEGVVSESSQLPFDSDPLDKVDDVGPGCQVFQCPMDDIVSQPSPQIAVRETVASSHCKSGNPELNKLVPHTKIKSNSLRHKGLPCNVQVITGSSGQSLVSGGQEMSFYADQLRNGMLGQNINMGEDLDSDAARGSTFTEVDPIPIPGPPGSFLPSPRDMASEDFQGNSSLTTSRIQSSQDQHDFIDGDSSDSPASATSTISNSTAGRYDHRSSESLPYIGPHAAQDNVRSGFSGGSIDSSIENAALVTRSTNVAVERLTSFDKAKFKVNQTPLSFKTDNEPCCCQRKERASQDVILNSQESQLLKRRLMASASLADVEGQTSCNLNTGPNNVEVWGDVFCSNSCPTLNSEKEVLPAAPKPPSSQHVLRDPMDAGVKFSGRSDCDSMSPSSNSILRLMGKNLMVVNRDQDKSMPAEQVQPQSQVNHLTPQFSTFTGVSPTSAVQSQAYHHSFSHPSSVILGRDPQNAEGQCTDARLSNGIRPRTSQMLYQGVTYPFPNRHMDGGFANTFEFCEFKADYTTTAAPQKMLKHRAIGARMDQAITIPDHQHMNLLSAADNPIKEIITIDDASESEADLTRDVAKYAGGFVRSHVVSSNVANPSYNIKCATPNFYGSRRAEEQALLPELPAVQSADFHALPGSRQANAGPVRWPSGCISDGSGVLQQSPFIATPSSSRGQLRSVLYK